MAKLTHISAKLPCHVCWDLLLSLATVWLFLDNFLQLSTSKESSTTVSKYRTTYNSSQYNNKMYTGHTNTSYLVRISSFIQHFLHNFQVAISSSQNETRPTRFLCKNNVHFTHNNWKKRLFTSSVSGAAPCFSK